MSFKHKMVSRSISAILWTLVGANALTLVVGGLITWLGYAIPARLKQFGLLPELVIIAGFASLVVACIGLCALNYSSHHALNIYGASCAIFVLLLVFGPPQAWYNSGHTSQGSMLMTIIYFSLLAILLILLVFAFTFANHLRKKEQERNDSNQQLEPSPTGLSTSDGYRMSATSAGSGGAMAACGSPNCTCVLNFNSDEPFYAPRETLELVQCNCSASQPNDARRGTIESSGLTNVGQQIKQKRFTWKAMAPNRIGAPLLLSANNHGAYCTGFACRPHQARRPRLRNEPEINHILQAANCATTRAASTPGDLMDQSELASQCPLAHMGYYRTERSLEVPSGNHRQSLRATRRAQSATSRLSSPALSLGLVPHPTGNCYDSD